MLPEKFNRMQQFETMIKQNVMAMFGKYLSEEQIKQILETEFIEKSTYQDVKDSATLQGNIIRCVVNGMINLRCTKEINVNGEDVNVEYGGALQNAAVEYYTQTIAATYGIKVNQKPEMAQDINMMEVINERLENGLDKHIFNKNAIELLDMVQMQELVEKADNAAIDEYLMKQSQLADAQEGKQDLGKAVEQNMQDPQGIEIINEGNKTYVKYTDEFGNVQLTESSNPEKTQEFYSAKLSSLAPGEKLDNRDFFHEISEIGNEINLTETEHVDQGYLNNEEVDMLSFVSATSTLKDERKNGMLHSGDQNIHIMKDTKDIVFSDSHDGAGVTADVHESENKEEKKPEEKPKTQEPQPTNNQQQNQPAMPSGPTDISEKMLTPEEYEELCVKYSSGTELTLEELRLLRNYEVQVRAPLMEMEAEEHMQMIQEKGPTLKMNNGSFYGFANKNILAYVIVILIVIGVAIGYFLFNVTH